MRTSDRSTSFLRMVEKSSFSLCQVMGTPPAAVAVYH